MNKNDNVSEKVMNSNKIDIYCTLCFNHFRQGFLKFYEYNSWLNIAVADRIDFAHKKS